MDPLSSWLDWLPRVGLPLLGILSVFSAGHALVNKRRSALNWVVVCLFWPGIGALVYWTMGVNRIETRARRLGERWPGLPEPSQVIDQDTGLADDSPMPSEASGLARISYEVTRQPLVGGNGVRPLENGEEAYPAMLEAIASARRCVFLSTYIFDNDATGKQFADALVAASNRGADIRVLIDGIGERYSLRRMGSVLKRRGIRVERFLPPSLRPPGIQINLRNHRKLLLVDGRVAFTGGMNLGDRHLVRGRSEKRCVKDLHFEIEGPVVAQLERTFLEDWSFVTGSAYTLTQPEKTASAGTSLCRGVNDGPNEDLDKLKWILLGSLSAARRHVRIMTPYFIPDPELVAALNTAALRGVRVEIVLPERNNLAYVAWAMQAQLNQVLAFGVRVYSQPGPFVHSKLFLVDEAYAMVGSANLDPRSLRLNFELNLEIYGGETPAQLIRHFELAKGRSRELSEPKLNARPVLVRMRDAAAALFSPYL